MNAIRARANVKSLHIMQVIIPHNYFKNDFVVVTVCIDKPLGKS